MDLELERAVLLSHDEMPPKLFILSCGDRFEVQLHGRQSLGRNTQLQTPDIPLASKAASRRHGEFTTALDGCTYLDCGSTNGTWLNGTLLRSHCPARLKNGDVLRIHGKDDKACELDAVLIYSTQYPMNSHWETQTLGPEIMEVAVGREEAIYPNRPPCPDGTHPFFTQETAGR